MLNNIALFKFCGKLCLSFPYKENMELKAIYNGKEKTNIEPIFTSTESVLYPLDQKEAFYQIDYTENKAKVTVAIIIPPYLSDRPVRISEYQTHKTTKGTEITVSIAESSLNVSAITLVSVNGKTTVLTDLKVTEYDKETNITAVVDLAKNDAIAEVYVG